MKKTIGKRAVFAEIHQDVRGGQLHEFSIDYVKADGSVGPKDR